MNVNVGSVYVALEPEPLGPAVIVGANGSGALMKTVPLETSGGVELPPAFDA